MVRRCLEGLKPRKAVGYVVQSGVKESALEMAVKPRQERGEIEEMAVVASAVDAFRSRDTGEWVRFLP